MNNAISPLPEPNKTNNFVNRDDQLNYVENQLKTIHSDQTIFDSILEWYGIPGIGKTTLSQIAITMRCKKIGIPFACIDFEPDKNEKAAQYSSDTILILEDIFKKIKEQKADDKADDFLNALKKYREATDENLREDRKNQVISKFLDYIKEMFPAALIFDSTEKADPEAIAWLEKEIISPICLTGRCLIIWTGRFPQRWRKFEVRRRVISQKLEPLLPDATIEQAQKEQISEKDGAVIYRFTGGHPRGNKELFNIIKGFKDENEKQQEEKLINAVNGVIEDWVMEDITHEINLACRVLAIVRQFDVIILRKLLSEFAEPYKNTESFLKVIGQLTATSLVEWDSVRKGYAVDETIRYILALYLKLTNPERYLKINEEAAGIYKDWIKKIRENRSIYVLERLYHLANISECNGENQAKITDKLQKELKGYLNKYYKDGEFAYSDTERLYNELMEDKELKKIVGEQGFNQLIETVDNHRKVLVKSDSK